MDKQDIGIAAALSGVLFSVFLSPPDLLAHLVYAVIGIVTTVCVGLAIRRLESPGNPLPQDQRARVAACATLGLIVAVVLVSLLGISVAEPG